MTLKIKNIYVLALLSAWLVPAFAQVNTDPNISATGVGTNAGGNGVAGTALYGGGNGGGGGGGNTAGAAGAGGTGGTCGGAGGGGGASAGGNSGAGGVGGNGCAYILTFY